MYVIVSVQHQCRFLGHSVWSNTFLVKIYPEIICIKDLFFKRGVYADDPRKLRSYWPDDEVHQIFTRYVARLPQIIYSMRGMPATRAICSACVNFFFLYLRPHEVVAGGMGSWTKVFIFFLLFLVFILCKVCHCIALCT